ncbi:MAG: replication endonuclease [Arcobacteraceae bacterium]|nr:replication endonuclease [Arcobacteraceae bacterium]
MNCTINNIEIPNSSNIDKNSSSLSFEYRLHAREEYNGTEKRNEMELLTIYKTVVDISKNEIFKPKYYGLNMFEYNEVQIKLEKQKHFLDNSYIYDKLSNNKIPLSTVTISSNINPKRYYSEIQNRINTLIDEAKSKNLIPIFLTLTLPSSYHQMKTDKKTNQLTPNNKYNNLPPNVAIKELTKMFARLRHDRSLKELSKENRIYYRVNEPHKDGTPHTHILLYVPKESVTRVVTAFKRLFDTKANDIQTDINNASAYIMKYINKTLPNSKQEKLTLQDKYLNAWYSKNKISRFNSSRTLAPLKLYRLLYRRFTLQELTYAVNNKQLQIFVLEDDRNKIMEVLDGDEILYMKCDNFEVSRCVA